MVSVIPRKKALIPSHSEFRGRANSEARNETERNGIPRKTLVLRNRTSPWYLYRGRWGELCTNIVKYTLKLGKVLQNTSKIRLPRFFLSWFLFHGMVRNGIPRDYLYYWLHGTEFPVVFSSGNGSERNSENLHLFWFHGTEFRVVFSSAEGFGTE
jgi:hypothetical protein